MTLFLDRIDSAPIINSDFDMQLLQWIWVLVDTLNEDLNDIQGAILSQTTVTDITQAVEINSSYIPTNVALTTFQLPDTASVGNRVTIAGFGAGGWIILVGSGQTIKDADTGASAAVSVASSSRYDCIEIVCVEENTTWVTFSGRTTGFVIV
jgi:hypothetical protein